MVKMCQHLQKWSKCVNISKNGQNVSTSPKMTIFLDPKFTISKHLHPNCAIQNDSSGSNSNPFRLRGLHSLLSRQGRANAAGQAEAIQELRPGGAEASPLPLWGRSFFGIFLVIPIATYILLDILLDILLYILLEFIRYMYVPGIYLGIF
jgi:hypothetical protein